MPFNIGNAAAFIRRVVLKFNQETLTIRYNAGEAYKEYEKRAQKLQQEFLDLQRQLEKKDAGDEAYQALMKRVSTTRLALAENICVVIESWDLTAPEEFDRTRIRERFLSEAKASGQAVSKEDLQKLNAVDGPGEIPVQGIWLHALPLPDRFIEQIVEKIGEDFSTGGAGGKAR